MTWVLCIMVPMVHTPRGRSGATFVKALAQSECGQFYHFGICGPNWDRHHSRLYTQIKVLGPASYPVSHWPYLGQASRAWE